MTRTALGVLTLSLCACGGAARGSHGSSTSMSPGADVASERPAPSAGADSPGPAVTTSASAEPIPVGSLASGTPTPQHAMQGWGEDYAELLSADGELGQALGLASVDCRGARELRDRICELSERICELAQANADRDTRARCADGAARCARATERVDGACPR